MVSSSQIFQLVQEVTVVIIIFLIIFWGLMYRDMVRNDALPDNAKSSWTLVFLFLNVFGAMIYYVVEYRNRNRR